MRCGKTHEFLKQHCIFDRRQYADAVGESGNGVVGERLGQLVREGVIRRVARGLYVVVPEHANPLIWLPDPFVMASRLRRDGVISHHSALHLQGVGEWTGSHIQLVAGGAARDVAAFGMTCSFTQMRVPYEDEDLTVVVRSGEAIAVTTLECTVADLFDRPDLSEGRGEIPDLLAKIGRLDGTRVLSRLCKLGNRPMAAAAAWWLENREESGRLAGSSAAMRHPRRPKLAGSPLAESLSFRLTAAFRNIDEAF